MQYGRITRTKGIITVHLVPASDVNADTFLRFPILNDIRLSSLFEKELLMIAFCFIVSIYLFVLAFSLLGRGKSLSLKGSDTEQEWNLKGWNDLFHCTVKSLGSKKNLTVSDEPWISSRRNENHSGTATLTNQAIDRTRKDPLKSFVRSGLPKLESTLIGESLG